MKRLELLPIFMASVVLLVYCLIFAAVAVLWCAFNVPFTTYTIVITCLLPIVFVAALLVATAIYSKEANKDD